MKNTIIFITLFLLYSCAADDCLPPLDYVPLQTKAITQEVSPTFDWENVTSFDIYGYGNTILPWYNATDASIPEEILEDYKKEEGWEMVYNLCSHSTASTYGKYYLIFYNKLRGILRVYYYNVYDATPATTTFWRLATSRPTSLLNNVGYYTKPMNESTSEIYTTNLTPLPSKGINKGWNCFEVELCYDNNISTDATKMTINSYNISQGDIKLKGSLDLSSEGTIVSTSSTSNLLGDMVNAGISGFGKEVKNMVSDELDSAKIHPLIATPIAEIISTGASGLIKAGINKLFGSFLSKKTTTTQTLKVKTTGTITSTGTISFSFNSNILSLANLIIPGAQSISTDYFFPSYDEPLGVWNLSEPPVVEYSSGAIWTKNDGSNKYDFGRIVRIKSVDVVMNPKVLECINKYDVDYSLMYFTKFNNQSYKTGYQNTSGYYDIETYTPALNGNLAYNSDECVLWDNPTRYGYVNNHHPRAEEYSRRGKEVWYLDDVQMESTNYVVKVTVTLYPKAPYDTTPIVSTRSYVPQYVVTKDLIDPNNW